MADLRTGWTKLIVHKEDGVADLRSARDGLERNFSDILSRARHEQLQRQIGEVYYPPYRLLSRHYPGDPCQSLPNEFIFRNRGGAGMIERRYKHRQCKDLHNNWSQCIYNSIKGIYPVTSAWTLQSESWLLGFKEWRYTISDRRTSLVHGKISPENYIR